MSCAIRSGKRSKEDGRVAAPSGFSRFEETCTFRVRAETQHGDVILLCGGTPGSGDWLRSSVQMRTSPAEYPCWFCQVQLPLPDGWQYKYVRRTQDGHGSTSLVWEWDSGPNRHFCRQGLRGPPVIEDIWGCFAIPKTFEDLIEAEPRSKFSTPALPSQPGVRQNTKSASEPSDKAWTWMEWFFRDSFSSLKKELEQDLQNRLQQLESELRNEKTCTEREMEKLKRNVNSISQAAMGKESIEQQLAKHQDMEQRLQANFDNLTDEVSKLQSKIQEDTCKLHTSLTENQTLTDRAMNKIQRNLMSMAPLTEAVSQLESRQMALEAGLRKMEQGVEGSSISRPTPPAAAEEKPSGRMSSPVETRFGRGSQLPARETCDDGSRLASSALPEPCTPPASPGRSSVPTARPDTAEVATGQGQGLPGPQAGQPRARSRARLSQAVPMFTKPPHPADAESRRITVQVETDLFASRARGDAPEKKRKFLKELYLRVHPDKGGTDAAMTWLTEWQKLHQDWYMSESFRFDDLRSS